jgi:hypothetical protein
MRRTDRRCLLLTQYKSASKRVVSLCFSSRCELIPLKEEERVSMSWFCDYATVVWSPWDEEAVFHKYHVFYVGRNPNSFSLIRPDLLLEGRIAGMLGEPNRVYQNTVLCERDENLWRLVLHSEARGCDVFHIASLRNTVTSSPPTLY